MGWQLLRLVLRIELLCLESLMALFFSGKEEYYEQVVVPHSPNQETTGLQVGLHRFGNYSLSINSLFRHAGLSASSRPDKVELSREPDSGFRRNDDSD